MNRPLTAILTVLTLFVCRPGQGGSGRPQNRRATARRDRLSDQRHRHAGAPDAAPGQPANGADRRTHRRRDRLSRRHHRRSPERSHPARLARIPRRRGGPKPQHPDRRLLRHNQRSPLAAAALSRLGYTDVYNYPGGYFAWRDAGLPVDSADKAPDSILYDKPREVADGVWSAVGATAPPTYENSGHNNNLSFIVTDEGVLVVNAGDNYLLARRPCTRKSANRHRSDR